MLDDKNIEIYSSRDKIREQLINYGKEYLDLEGVDFNKSSYLSYLINLLSVLSSDNLYYSSSIYREFFLTKALQRETILNISSMLGYKPPVAEAAKVPVLFQMPLTFKSDTEFRLSSREFHQHPEDIDRGPFKLYTNQNMVFTLLNPIDVKVFKNGDSYQIEIEEKIVDQFGNQLGVRVIPSTIENSKAFFVINALQIEEKVFEFQIPRLQRYEFHNLDLNFDGSITDIDLAMTTNITSEINPKRIWKYYDSLYLIPPEERGFTYRETDNGIRLFFGNGVIGRQPEENEICKIIVQVTEGSKGNVISGAITEADDVYVQDSDRTKVLNLNVLNTTPASGGKDSPTIDEIKVNAMAHVSSNNRLVSQSDYIDSNKTISEMPSDNSIYILKRSDIKSNEITSYNNIIFEETIVPTINETITISKETHPRDKMFTEEVFEIDGENYVSLFNISVDYDRQESNYEYVLPFSIRTPVITTFHSDNNPDVEGNRSISQPNLVRFLVTQDEEDKNDKLNISLRYSKLIEEFDYSNITAFILYKDNWHQLKKVEEMENDEYGVFTLEEDFSLDHISNGPQTFYFRMYNPDKDKDDPEYDPKENPLTNSQTKLTIRRDLSDFMYSTVSVEDESAKIYDVPLIKESYYNRLKNENKRNIFWINILEKITEIDISKYKMVSDFLNIKFSNTVGKIDNMKYNKIIKKVEDLDDIDDLKLNDIVYVKSIEEKRILTEDGLTEFTQTIPLKINMDVWIDPKYSGTEQSVIDKIKNKLIDNFANVFDFNATIHLSEINRIVKSISGVQNCKITNPKHDIFFDFDIYKDLTQEELLEYSPQFIYFDTNSINIEIR
ncbi:MAG: hypothetical protein ACOCQD_01610 [archaeon]